MHTELPENNFWLRLWQSVMIAIAFLMACVTFYNANLHSIQEGLVRSGNDPIAVRCMTANPADPICVSYTAGRK